MSSGSKVLLDGRSFEVVDEIEEDVDVDGFGNEGEIANSEGALAVLFARITRYRNCRYIAHAGKETELFEELIAVNVRHTDV